MIAFAAAVFLPFLAGYLLASLTFDRNVPGSRGEIALLKGFLAIGLALGGASCIFFLWLTLVGAPGPHYIMMETLAVGALAAGAAYRIKASHQDVSAARAQASIPTSPVVVVLLVSFGIILITRLYRFVSIALDLPQGGDDALGIWNLRARFLLTGGDQWRESLSLLLAKSNTPDYPLLLPGTVARLWVYWGADSPFVPQAVAMLFTVAIIGLGVSALALLRSHSQGLLAGLVLAGTPFLISHGASQYADVPLAFYILATLVLFCLQDDSEAGHDRLLTLAGAMAGFAAWTKNEGALFLAAIVLARLAVVVPRHGWKEYLRQMGAFTAGLLPLLALVVYFKTRISPATTAIISQGSQSILDKLRDLASYQEVGIALAAKIIELGHPGFVVPALYLGFLGMSRKWTAKAGFATALLVLMLMLAGYAVVIIATPFNSVRYQLAYSLDRLWIHLWPSVVLVFFLWVRTPEEAMEAEQREGADTHGQTSVGE
jgi:hypothetical protein